jgi:hypothetical protein
MSGNWRPGAVGAGLGHAHARTATIPGRPNVCSVVLSGAPITIPRVTENSGEALVHPSVGRRSAIWWAGDRGGPWLPELDREVVGTIALSQSLVARNAGFVSAVRRQHGFGLMLEGDAWKAQLDPGHALRVPSFEALRWVEAGARHRPETWSRALSEDFVEAYVGEQARHATLLMTPGHYEAEPTGPVHRRDVELAELAADHVRAKALREPVDGDERRIARELYASILLRMGRVDDAERRWLVDAYKSIDVDGHIVWAVDFSGSEVQVERLLALVDALSEATGKPVAVAGVGHFWQLMLSRGAAAAVHGRRTALHWPPDALEPKAAAPAKDDEDEDGWGIAVYHGAILGCVRIGKDGDAVRNRLFMLRNCECGAHDPSTPPRGHKEILAHNLWWAMRGARTVCLQDVGRATFLLALHAAGAKTSRERLGLAELKTGWRVLAGAHERSEEDGGA